ncbi:replication factor A, partial [mine drainage metagenome]
NLNLKDAFVSVSGLLKDPIEKTYEKDGQEKIVTHCTLEDDTGSIRLSLFDRKLSPGRYYKIDGTKLSEYKGRYRLTAGDKTQIAEVSGFHLPEIRVYDLNELRTPVDSISTSGVVVYLGEKGGLISRCSECRKTVDDIRCPDHPEAKIFLDLYAYFTIEDGTGDMQCN